MEVVLGMSFFTLGNADIQFAKKELIWRTYITEEALSTICRVKIIDQKEFAKVALDKNVEAFVVHFSSLKSKMTVHPAKKAQLALLLTKKVTLPTKYPNFADISWRCQQTYSQSGPEQMSMRSSQKRANYHLIDPSIA